MLPRIKNAATFHAEISEAPTTSVSVLVSHLTDWVSTGTAISIGTLFITVDRTCSIVIVSFISKECQADIITLATRSTEATVNAVEIITSIVVLLSIAAVVVILVIVIIKRQQTKSKLPQCSDHDR